MKKSIICLSLVLIMTFGLCVSAWAAEIPDVNVSFTAPVNNIITVTVEFVNVPQNNPVEYAQILLTCRSSQHNIVSNSMTLLASGDMVVTKQFNTTTDSLLVLMEPKQSNFPGITSSQVYTFTIKQTGSGDPSFDLSAVLILKDGTEKEINRQITGSDPAPTTPTTPVNPTNPTNPTDPTNPVNPGSTNPSTAPNPGSTNPSTDPNPGTTQPTTVPNPGTTQPSTAGGSQITLGGNGNGNMLLLGLGLVVVVLMAGTCMLIIIKRKNG